jgi:stage II sporulation protein R
MKKTGIIIALLAVVAAVLLLAPSEESAEQYFRIHIRANSNQSADQNVKYKVKDEAVKYLTPYLAECETFQEAFDKIESLKSDIEAVADRVLGENGFSYKSAASVRREEFPTRSYDGFVLESGLYDALIIELGAGTGDNWWCVVYPPLCFINASPNGTGEIRYRSKIIEIIERFKNGK